jgi:glycosyltransferase involved in cell wall biosynthesis
MSSVLVSVLIPTYNRGYAIHRAIDSALAQDCESIEILVIDDGSTDGTRELIRQRYQGDPRVRYFYKDNGGVSSARNLGIRECRGEFLAFLDSDDWWLPGKLALQLAGLRLVPEAGMIWTEMQAVGAEGQVLHPRFLRQIYHTYRYFKTPREIFTKELTVRAGTSGEVTLYAGDIFSQMALGNLVHTSTVLLRRDRLMKVGFFREDYRTGEDYEFHLRTCKHGPVAFADTVTISYKIGMDDALTVPANGLPMAINFVETLEQTLREDRDRFTLSESLLQDSVARAYAWLGRAYMADGQLRRAQSYLLKSLRTKAWQPRQLVCLAAVSLPPKAFTLLRRLRKQRTGIA